MNSSMAAGMSTDISRCMFSSVSPVSRCVHRRSGGNHEAIEIYLSVCCIFHSHCPVLYTVTAFLVLFDKLLL